jgi:CheY-like chemotaxis protein
MRLLIVEDHESTRHVLARLLQRAGHHVEAAATGAEALDLLKSAGPFDAMISDLGLPDQSGLDLVKSARQLQPSLFAIALSGYGMEEDIERGKAAGFMAHLVKPVPMEQLRALLERAAVTFLPDQASRANNELPP